MFDILFDIKAKLKNYIRVLKISKKPSREDFINSARICLIGMIVLGIIGFFIYLMVKPFPI